MMWGTSREEAVVSRLVVNLLGGFQVSLDSGAPCALPTKRAQALLAYLSLDPGRAYSRDTLASLLWGERPDAQARKNLRQTVYALRKAMPDAGDALLLLEGEGIALNPAAIEADVPRFERLVREGTPEALEGAAALYRGDLLHGFSLDETGFEEWLVVERERLRELAIEGLAKLLAHQARTSATEQGIQTAVRLLALDPLQEVVHRTLMRLYARQGRRTAALRQYQMCVDVLQRELRTEPEAETKQLYQELLQQRREARTERDADPRPARPQVGVAGGGRQLELPVQVTPLIGRDSELERLRDLARQAEGGQGRIVVVLGEAGIGKTRLVAEVAAEALERGSDVLLGRAFESEQLLAFGPWVAAIRSRRVLEEPGALDALAPAWQNQLARLFPEVGDPAAVTEVGSEDYRRLFEAMERLLSTLAERRPMVIILEDLHWADEMSLRLLSYLGRRTHAWKLLVVASAREEELVGAAALRRAIDGLLQEDRCIELTLARLTRRGTIELVRALTRSGGQTSADLEEQIWTASEGNPFMAVEIIRALEQGAEVSPTSGWTAPDRVRRLITGRLDRLSARGQQLAAVAAVIGREFDFSLLQRASGLSGREAAEAVEELVRRRVLQGAGERLDFTHDRFREVAYRRLLPSSRQVLHREVARALEAMHAAAPSSQHEAEPVDADRLPEVFEALAWHYSQGHEWSKAVDNLLNAADKARNHYAYHEASRRCTEAIEILDRQGGATAETVRALEMLGDLESVQGHIGFANQAYHRALRMSGDTVIHQRIGDKLHRPSTVVRDGVAIAYYEHGTGEPTLFLTHPVFYGQGTYQPLLDLLCHEFRIITSDPRGVGRSDPLPALYTLRDHVEDARAVIEGAGNRPVVFVGMSRAAALGVVLATTYPHLVERLVLVGTPPAPFASADCAGIDQDFWQEVVGMIEAGDYKRAMPFFWTREFSEPDTRDLVKAFVQASLEMPREVFRVFFTVPDPGRDIRHLLPMVRVPTLVLHGEEDRLVPVEAGRWVARQIPGAEFYGFKGCGHLPAFTAAAEFARVVSRFLRTGRAV